MRRRILHPISCCSVTNTSRIQSALSTRTTSCRTSGTDRSHPSKKSLVRTRMERRVSLFTPLRRGNPSKTSFSTLAIATPALFCPRLMHLDLGFIATRALFKSLRTRIFGSILDIKRTMEKFWMANSSRSVAHQNPVPNS